MKLYTTVETARALGKTRNTIIRWVEEHRMKPFATADDVPLFTGEEIERVRGELRRRKTPDTLDTEELILT